MDTLDSQRHRIGSSSDAAHVTFDATRTVLTIFALMVFLGFPGKLSLLIGSGPCKMLEYASWGVQLTLILLASGDDVWNIKLLDLRPYYWLIYLYLIYNFASSMYVVEKRKAVLITLIHLILTAMFALWLVEAYEPEQLMEVFYYSQFVIVLIVLAGTVAFPKVVFYTYQGSRTLRGLYATKNEFGTEVSFGILVQCILFRIRREKHKPVSLIFIATMVVQFGMILVSKNMGALLITIGFISYILYYGMSKTKLRLPIGLLFVAGSIAFLIFALTVLQALGPFLESLGKDASLTGRVPLWEQSIAVMTETHTMTGYGYEMFWYTPSAVDLFHSGFDANSWAGSSSASSHNMVMELWLNTGLIGVALLFLLFIRSDRGVKHLEENQYLFCSSFIVMFTIRGLTERQSAAGLIYVLVEYMVLAILFQAEAHHKLELRRKARIYVGDEEDANGYSARTNALSREAEASELAAFQRKFSNIAQTQEKAQIKRPMRNEWDEVPEKTKSLDDLFRELDDDNW